jgi:UDP-N-acetylmuramate--alanine ligase
MGLSALALYMQKMGYEVSGSDVNFSKTLDMLIENGITAYVGHGKLSDVDLVVRSSAVEESDAEVSQALKKGIKVLERMEFFSRYVKPDVGITGTDGKSSTTCMIAWIALKNGLDPTLLCGAFSKGFDNSNFRFGKGPLIAEVDESDPKMKDVVSKIAVLTNLRYDHLNRYADDPNAQQESVKHFLFNAKKRIVPMNVMNSIQGENVFKIGKNGNLDYEIIKSEFSKQEFKIRYNGKEFFGELPVAGKHQVENAVTSVGAALAMGLSVEESLKALKSYPGVSRRLEILNDKYPVVISDYAHTPSEVKAALDSIVPYFKDVVVIFEPHRYSRLKREYKNFVKALEVSKKVIVTDVFEAFEEKKDVKDIKVESLMEELKSHGVDVKYWGINDDALEILRIFKSDAYAFLGAGKIDSKAREFARKVTKK